MKDVCRVLSQCRVEECELEASLSEGERVSVQPSF